MTDSPKHKTGTGVRAVVLSAADFVGGAERSMAELARRLAVRGHGLRVLLPAEGELSRLLSAQGVDWHALGVPSPYTRRWARPLRALLRMRRAVAPGSVDLVHINSVPWLYAGVLLARSLGVPAVLHLRDRLDPASVRGLRRAFLRRLDAVAAISHYVAAPLEGLVPVEVVPNAVDPGPFRDASALARGRALRAAWGVPEHAVLAGAVGWLLPRKGLETFLEAAALASHPPLRFAVVGRDPFPDRGYGRALETRAAGADLAGRVVFPGAVDDPPGVMAALDVLVMAAPQEPFGRTLIEAMAASRPVAAVRAGAVPEIVRDGDGGLLWPEGDAAGLAAVLLRLAGDPELRTRLGRAGSARVEAEFGWDRCAAGVEGVWSRVL